MDIANINKLIGEKKKASVSKQPGQGKNGSKDKYGEADYDFEW